MNEHRSLSRAGLALKLLLTGAIILQAASCRATREPSPALRMHAAPTNNLSPSDRAEIFELVWGIVNETYYDSSFRGVDWKAVRERYRPRMEAAPNDQEFYALFELMLAELRDAHTGFSPPPPPGTPPDGQPGSLGLSLAEIDGQTVVSEVEAGSGAARAGVRPGMILRTVNGRPVDELYALIRANFAGTSSERAFGVLQRRAILHGGFLSKPRTLGLVDFDNSAFEVTLEQTATTATRAAHLEARRLASGCGYIKFDSWAPPADRRFNEELAKLSGTTGLIIDLRGNGGGQTDVLHNIASNFFAAPTYTGGFRRRDGTLDRYMTHVPEQVYRQPVVILIDERSASASETFTTFMQESRRAHIIGRQSNGSTLNTRIRRVKGGGELRVSIRAYISPGGRNPEGTGVVPDEAVPLTISDLRQGRDAALEAAEAYLAATAQRALKGDRNARPSQP
ncbi:MAG TPA: S41 family peptidase [Pyrinomonadaceae bacterium]|nr:S41 family peptidase [Pyrinomonadaceae bacterium]